MTMHDVQFPAEMSVPIRDGGHEEHVEFECLHQALNTTKSQ